MSRESDAIEAERNLVARYDAFIEKLTEKSNALADPSDIEPIMAEFHLLDDSSPVHYQSLGWRHATAILMEQLRSGVDVDNSGAANEIDVHRRYAALERRQLSYPFLASWRLCIEVELKDCLKEIHQCLEMELPSALRRALRGHDVGFLWDRLNLVLADLSAAAHGVANELGIESDAPGLQLSVAEHEQSLRFLVDIDPEGQSLRYEENIHGDRNMPNVTEIDLANAHHRFTGVFDYLQRLSAWATTITGRRTALRHLARLRGIDPTR